MKLYWPPENTRHSVPGVMGPWAWLTKQLHLVCKTQSLSKKNHSLEARSRDRDLVSVKYPWGASGPASGNYRPLESSGSKSWGLALSHPLGSHLLFQWGCMGKDPMSFLTWAALGGCIYHVRGTWIQGRLLALRVPWLPPSSTHTGQ